MVTPDDPTEGDGINLEGPQATFLRINSKVACNEPLFYSEEKPETLEPENYWLGSLVADISESQARLRHRLQNNDIVRFPVIKKKKREFKKKN